VSAGLRIEKLRPDHPIENFDCGRHDLNHHLVRFAWTNQQAGAAWTWLGLAGDSIVGYYTLAPGQVMRAEAPERLSKGRGPHTVPILLLARLLVDRRWQGQGVGRQLLRDAMLRALHAAGIAGIRAFVAHAKDEEARRFYERFDFIPAPSDPMHLFIPLGDARYFSANQT
jgi:GNAT superfamily N-acetyltransferase